MEYMKFSTELKSNNKKIYKYESIFCIEIGIKSTYAYPDVEFEVRVLF